ncbi:MAG: hypothetical protein ACOC97_03115 [Myxococcota bacterium]
MQGMDCGKRRCPLGIAWVGLLAVMGCSGDGDTVGGATAAVEEPPELSSGVSTVENRRVYAPDPDEGEIVIPLTLGLCAPGEFCIKEQSQADGWAEVRIVYSRPNNTVDVYFEFEGLPYRPTYEKDYDDSTKFNPQFTKVEDARWQLWLIGTMFGTQTEKLYYDNETMKFLGTRFDFEPYRDWPFPEEGTYFTLDAPVVQMICSPVFEGNPDGTGSVHFQLRFDRMEDAAGSPGVLTSFHPHDLCEPDQVNNYWTQTRLPDEMFMSFDTFLNAIYNGDGIGIAMSAEPYPKPPELAYRDNTFITWGNMYPALIPPGFQPDFRNGNIEPLEVGSEQIEFWPSSGVNVCEQGS